MLHLQIEKIIKQKGLSATKIRKKVLKAFLILDKPLSLQELKKSINNIDRVTLFRILSVFEKHKIIHKIQLEKSEKLYALCHQECKKNEHSHNHIHFHCQSCDDVMCLPIQEFPSLSVPFYIINNVNINASGVCAQCNG